MLAAAIPAAPSPAAAHAFPAQQDTARADTARIGRELRRGVQPRDAAGAEGEGMRAGAAADGVASDFPRPDSVMELLLRRAGYRPVVYYGDTLHFSAEDRSLRIKERARFERAGERFSSDSVYYNAETRYVTAFGESKLVNERGEEVESEVGPVFYHTERRLGTFMNARTQWEVWNVRGDFTIEGSDTLWVNEGIFTSCNLPEPHYFFAADRIKMVLGNIVVAWPVRLHFGDVPVFWLPFIAQDIRSGRHSGILTPRFGLNDIVRNSTGYRRHVSNIGYYWAISDYMDAQLGLDWWSGRWTRLDGFFRYRWRERFLDGRLGYSQFFLPDGERELSFNWNHSQQFGERTRLRAAIDFVSSQRFRQRNEFDPDQLVQQIRSDIGLTRRFDWGTLNLSGQRVQPLTEGRTTLTFPQASVTLNPIEFFPAPSPVQARWFHGLTWNGSGRFGRQLDQVPGEPDRTTMDASLTSGWSLGNFRLSSNASFRDLTVDRPDTLIGDPDTVVVDGDSLIVRDTTVIGSQVREGSVNWNNSIGYQQRLIGSTTLTPSLQASGTLFRSNETGLDFVSGPTRYSVNAGLNSDIYGFFPGIGGLQRIRHKFSPRLDWSYSPEVTPSPELAALRGFSPGTAAEQHRLSFTLAQTFEAKLPPRRDPEGADTTAEGDTAEVADTVSAVTPTAASDAAGPESERKIMLLAIRTSALLYDFVEGRVTTDRLSNNITSDLLRGLTVRLDHDLFRERADGSRAFAPFLSGVNLGFSIGDRSAGLARSVSQGVAEGRGLIPEAEEMRPEDMEDAEDVEDVEERQAREGELEGREERPVRRPWSLSVDYSLVRQRPEPGLVTDPLTRQSLRMNLDLAPTDNWTVSWRTTYDVEAREFTDHIVSLRRDLHRWSATFDFLRAANGNFLFEFRVNLNDLPDIKFDYRQESEPAGLGAIQ